MRALYFVDSIHYSRGFNLTEERNGDEEVAVTLLPTGEAALAADDNGNGAITVTTQSSRLQYDRRGGNIREGWYVYYNDTPEEGQLMFAYGNGAPYAQSQISLNNSLRAQLLANSNGFADAMSEDDLRTLLYDTDVNSYHVNVGHGNCSLLLIRSHKRPQIWMVDCSIHETPNKLVGNTFHRAELDACLMQLANDAGIKVQDIHIDRFFLTHMHYDHYNGMRCLINSGYINQDTIFYVNLNYAMPSPGLNAILQQMINLGCTKIVEPLTTNSSPTIQILYPNCHLFKDGRTITSRVNYRIEKNVNDSSSVIRINLGWRSMVYTGDIEQDGLQIMSSYLGYPPICFTDIYAVSHHGSENGHPLSVSFTIPPYYGKGRNVPWISLIMGRDGAFNGIFSPKVINDFNYISNIVTTDDKPDGKPSSFLRIDWESGQVNKF